MSQEFENPGVHDTGRCSSDVIAIRKVELELRNDSRSKAVAKRGVRKQVSDMPEHPTESTVAVLSAEVAAATLGNIMFVIWHLPPTASTTRRLADVLRKITSENPGNCGYFCVVEEAAGNPNAEVRRIARECFAELGKKLTAVAYAFEGPRLKTMARKLIVSSMGAFDDSTRGFLSVDSARSWLCEILENVPANLLSEVARLRVIIEDEQK